MADMAVAGRRVEILERVAEAVVVPAAVVVALMETAMFMGAVAAVRVGRER